MDNQLSASCEGVQRNRDMEFRKTKCDGQHVLVDKGAGLQACPPEVFLQNPLGKRKNLLKMEEKRETVLFKNFKPRMRLRLRKIKLIRF